MELVPFLRGLTCPQALVKFKGFQALTPHQSAAFLTEAGRGRPRTDQEGAGRGRGHELVGPIKAARSGAGIIPPGCV